MINGTKGNNVLISTAYPEWDANLYPRVRLYNSTGTELGASPKNLTYIDNGCYYNNDWIPSTSGYYQVVFLTYTDAGYTTSSNNYGIASDTIIIDESTTSNINYISSQVAYISSATEKFGYGGGGGKSYVIPGRKSPWTHKQRDEIIKNVEETKNLVEGINKKVTDYYNEEMKALDSLIKSLEELYNKIKTTTKSDSGKILNEIAYSIKVLKENREKLRNINTVDEIPNIKKDVENIYSMTSMLLSDEMIQEQEEREKKK